MNVRESLTDKLRFKAMRAQLRVMIVWWRTISFLTGGRYCPHGAGFGCTACAEERRLKNTLPPTIAPTTRPLGFSAQRTVRKQIFDALARGKNLVYLDPKADPRDQH